MEKSAVIRMEFRLRHDKKFRKECFNANCARRVTGTGNLLFFNGFPFMLSCSDFIK
jgi:hypothetical protein